MGVPTRKQIKRNKKPKKDVYKVLGVGDAIATVNMYTVREFLNLCI